MAYNRWINDDLEHSGVIGMKWHHRNGPPYPLDRSLSDGHRLLPKATGSPQGKKRTPTRGGVSKAGKKDQIHSDYGDSLAARAKRKYEDYKKTRSEERAREAEEERRAAQKDAELYKEQQKRMEDMNLSVEARRGIHEIALDFQDTNDDRQGEALKTAIDLYDKRTKSIKEHGTADEVLKNRERFSKEDMEYISSRLESEAKVQKYASKPVEQIPASKTKGENLYDKGSAKDVYRNRSELTVEQLETVQRRLNAENKIGEIASKQVDLDSKNMERLKKVRDVLKVLGDSADSIQKIQKIFPKNNQNNNNNNNNNNNQNRAAQAVETGRRIFGLVNVVRDVSNSYNQGNQQRQNNNNQQQQNNNQQRQNQGNQQRQGNQQQANQQRQGNQQRQNQNQTFNRTDPRSQSSDEQLRRNANGYRNVAETFRQAEALARSQGDNEAANSSRAAAERNAAEATRYENELRLRRGQPLQSNSSGSNTQQRQTSNSSGSNTQQRQSSNSSTRSNTTQRSSVSDLIDRLSTIEVVMTDESRGGKVDPLERIGRTFTDEERKKR